MLKKELMPGALLHELMRARHHAVQTELAARGLGDLGAPMIIFALRHRARAGEPAVQRDLAETLRVSPATVAISLKSLERGGYVEKQADPDDARRKRIALTKKGDAAVETCMEAMHTVDKQMFAGISPEEVERFTRFVQRLRSNLEEKRCCHHWQEGGRRHV